MEVYQISSINNQLVKDCAKLKDKKYRAKEKKFLVEGYHLIEEALNSNSLVSVFITKAEDKRKFKDTNIKVYKTTLDVITKLSDTTTPQGIVAVCEIKEKEVDYKNISRILVLDDVSDPGNVGTLIRTSLGFNIDLILMSQNCADIYNSKVVRASQGAIFSQNIKYCDLLEEFKLLKDNGIKIISTSLQSETYLSALSNIEKYAIVLGNEANGVRKEVQDAADINVKIEISPALESLNVSIAGSIMMYELAKHI